MSTCKDCIHYEACERNTLLTEFNRDNPAYCKAFADKSLYIKLPCKVGDTVYGHNSEGVTEYTVIGILIGKADLHFHCHNHSSDFWSTGFGRYIFLTREEAEAALKEREK